MKTFITLLLTLTTISINYTEGQSTKNQLTGIWKMTLGEANNPCDIIYHVEYLNDTFRVKTSFPLFGSAMYLENPAGNGTMQDSVVILPNFTGKFISPEIIKGVADMFGTKFDAIFIKIKELPTPDIDRTPENKSMAPLWKFQTHGEIWGSPLVNDKMIYTGSDDSMLYCLSLEQGNKIWSFQTQGRVRSTPLLQQGKLVFSSDDGIVYALDPKNGKMVWKSCINAHPSKRDVPRWEANCTWDYMQSSPVYDQGRIYIG